MARGDGTRLFLLGELARRGRAHGHELRREAQIGRTELWTDVHIGSIYSTLRRLEQEGLIEVLRSEQEGRMPERTVYAPTEEGRRELRVLRSAMLREVAIPADSFDLALSLSEDVPAEELRGVLQDRIAALEAQARSLEHQRRAAEPHLDERDRLLIAHLAARIETDRTWLGEVIATLVPGELETKEETTDDR